MTKSPSTRVGQAKRNASTEYHALELKMVSLFSKLSSVYNKTTLLTEVLQSNGCGQAATETFEVEVLLKNALRILGDAMSHIPS
jgi:hypothetical protein